MISRNYKTAVMSAAVFAALNVGWLALNGVKYGPENINLKDSTRQYKTVQDRTRQNKTEQDDITRTRQNKTAVAFHHQIDEYVSAFIEQNSTGNVTVGGVHYGPLSTHLILEAFGNQTFYIVGDSLGQFLYDFIRKYQVNVLFRYLNPVQGVFNGEVVRTDLLHNRTDILFTNFALYWGMTMFPTKWPAKYQYVATANVFLLDKHMMDVVNVAKETNAKCIFFRTPNPLCEMYRWGEMQIINEFYHNLEDISLNRFNAAECAKKASAVDPLQDDRYGLSLNRTELCDENILKEKGLEFASRCTEEVEKSLNYSAFDNAAEMLIHNTCTFQYSFTNIGVKNVRQSMMDFVEQNQGPLFLETGIKLILFDYHEIVRGVEDYCHYGHDTMHFPGLVPVQLNLLANIVDQHCT